MSAIHYSVSRRNEQAILTAAGRRQDFSGCFTVRRDRRQPASHRLYKCKPETFSERRQDEEIGFGHELSEHLWPRAGGRPKRERVAFGNGALARIGGDHRRRNELGQGAQPVARLRIEHALPGQQQRIFRLEQHAHRGLDRVGIRRRALDRNGSVVELAPVLGFPYFGRNLDEDGPALAAAHGVIGAAHQVGQLLDRMRQRRPLGDRPVDLGSAEDRPDILSRQRQPGRNDQERDVFGKGLGDAGKGVFDAGPGLGGEYAVALAALDTGIAVREADADALLPAQNRTDVERGAGLDQRVAGIAGEELRSLAP